MIISKEQENKYKKAPLCVKIAFFAITHEEYLKQYIGLENGVPSHDTIRRVMGLINPVYMQQLQEKWIRSGHFFAALSGRRDSGVLNAKGLYPAICVP